MNHITEIIETGRYYKCIVIDSFKFRINKDSDIFRCTNRNCNITAKICHSMKFVISINGDHNHKVLQE